MAEGQSELTASHHRLEARVDCIQADVSGLKQDVKDVKGDVSGLKQDMTEVKNDVFGLKQDMTEVKTDVSGLKKSVDKLNKSVAGLGKGLGYAMENESYRALPAFLRRFGIEVTEKFIRTEIAGEEINFLARGIREGQGVLVVGETTARISNVGRKIKQLARKFQAVQQTYPDMELVRILVTHYAAPDAVAWARERGVMVIQSFEL